MKAKEFSMLRFFCLCQSSSKSKANGLMAKADAQNGKVAWSVMDQRKDFLRGRARSRTKDKVGCMSWDFVLCCDSDLHLQRLKRMSDVVGERIEVVDEN